MKVALPLEGLNTTYTLKVDVINPVRLPILSKNRLRQSNLKYPINAIYVSIFA